MALPEQGRRALCGDRYHRINSCSACLRIYRQERRIRADAKPKRPHFQATKNVGPQCPECGSVSSRSIARGWSEPDDNYLRRRKCDNCSCLFATAEVVIPPSETTFYRLDYRGREWRRDNYRRRYAKTDRKLPVQHSDRLKITVRVFPNPELNQRERTTCYRGHPFTPENTYIYPETGHRACITCRYQRYRARREERAA